MSRGPNMGGLAFATTKENQIRRMWADHNRLMSEIKDTCFKLLAHPDATDEDLQVIREKAIDMHKRHIDMLNLMRSKGFNVD